MNDETEKDERHHRWIAGQELGKEFAVEVGEDFLEHHARCLKGGIGKKEPAKTDEMEGENDGQEATNARWMVAFIMPQTVLPCFVSAECRSMKGAPHYEVPRGSMPQAAENHGHKLIKIHAPTAATVAPHRNVEVVAKPGGEGDVPTAPEVGDTVGLVGGAEVGGNLEAHPEGDANGDVAVAGEVAIELQGIAIDAHEIFKPSVERGVVEDAVDKVLSDIVGDDGLLKESHHDEPQACSKHLARHNERLPKLRQEGAGTKDGARKQGGEEGHEKGQVEQIAGGAHLTAVDVDDVAQRLEGKEGNAERHEDVERRCLAAKEGDDRREKEIGVFEEAKLEEHEGHGEDEDGTAFSLRLHAIHGEGRTEIHERDQRQKGAIGTSVLIVEIIRKGGYVEQTQSRVLLSRQQGITQAEGHEEEQEKAAVEQQGLCGREGQEVEKGLCHEGLLVVDWLLRRYWL